jgi:thiol-disulfide isomerase/thioredoxin
MRKIILLVILAVLIVIVMYQLSKSKENFESEKVKVLVFLSKSCPHCVTYKNDEESKVTSVLQNMPNVEYKSMFCDEEPELSDKYKVLYVPTCFVEKGTKSEQLTGNVTAKNIIEKMTSM